jgi:DNA-binding SARP family transcriptional activator
MSLVAVQLLGRPRVRVDGFDVPGPKGAKPWGLLAYLAASKRPHPRTELAELLFSEAIDPLGALRWNLAALRRLLDRPDALKGDAICLDRADVCVDIVQLEQGVVDVVLADGNGRELLAGLHFSDSPMFELWLAGERQRQRRRVLSFLREVSLDAFAMGDPQLAIRTANELVMLEPFDEGHHALLIRTLALSGDRAAAQNQFEQCALLLRSELDIGPGPAVLAAARLVTHHIDLTSKPEFDEVFARMIVAWQSFLSGAIDHGLDTSRNAVALADAHGDVTLRIAGRLFLAGMLNMSVRSWDEAATTTAEAHRLASDMQRLQEQAMARSILAGSELMRGDYRAALVHSQTGAALSDDPGTRALNLAFQSAVESDIGHHEDAVSHALAAIEYAEINADPVQLAYAHAYAAHAEIVAGHHHLARPHAQRAIDACASVLVLKPWPMAMLAEIQVHAGDLRRAARTATEADGLASVTGISYQRALAQRALALGEAAAGDDAAALERLVVALAHARRTGGEGYSFHWPVAWVLESLASIATRSRPHEAKRWAAALKDHASTTGMSTFAARADHLLACTVNR